VKLIVGLGNPGREYEQTRHNVGWWVVNHLADVWHFDGWRRDVGGHRVRLMKPQTFMNLSGGALRQYARRPTWKSATDLLVILDEVALPVESLRLRARGSAGGHNGLKSVESVLQTQDYARLRIGIHPTEEGRVVGDLSDFVLDRFSKDERERILAMMPTFAALAEVWVREGVDKAMRDFNRRERGGGSESPENAEPRKD
jgi:peptidyl-tRNA hydrolase, PTH1 family